MNKVFQVNLGGIPFTINEDAYVQLVAYLDSLKAMFGNEHGPEIIQDIESRIAELFTERLGKRLIVESHDVSAIIDVIGRPEDLGHEPAGNASGSTSDGKGFEFKTGKRLYRNPDEKVIGGVASGIAAYFGIKDPIWIRIAMVILFLISRGTAVIAYFILMSIIKEAKTSKEKLEMRGDPINLANLSGTLEKEVNGFSQKFKKYTSKQKSTQDGESMSTEATEDAGISGQWLAKLEEWLMGLGQSVEYGLKGLTRILAPLIKLTGGVVLMVLIVVWTAILISLIIGKPVIMMFMPANHIVTGLGLINLYAVLLLPFIALAILIVKWFFRRRVHNAILGGLFGLWFINIVSLSVIGSKTVQEFSTPFSLINNLLQQGNTVQSYFLKVNKPSSDTGYKIGSLSFNNQILQLTPTRLLIEKSEDENYYLLQELQARGMNESDASQAAKALTFETNLQGDTIAISEAARLPLKEKYRGQTLKYTLKIPENKSIQFDKDLGSLVVTSRLPGSPVYNQAVRSKKLKIVRDSIQVFE
jgi:phage shock protein PspC (stress-responsive transcriptional regulator)